MYGQPSKISHVLVKITLRYKLKGCTFDSRWYHWNYFVDVTLLAALWL
jgi:hypothetical protein